MTAALGMNRTGFMRPASLTVVVLASWLALAGCFEAPAARLAADGASTVTVGYCCGREVFSPAHDMDAKLLVFEPLMKRDAQGRLTGHLARSWTPSPDYREWTYRLRSDVRWHDGVRFTAHDVAFTISLMERWEDLDYGAGAFESVTVHDDTTVTIRSGHGRRIYQTWMVFYPKHLLEGLDPASLTKWSFWEKPVGNGPYRVVRMDPATMVELEANEEFYRGKPSIERVILKFSADAGLTELMAGQVDAISGVPAPDVPTLAGDPRFAVHWGGGESTAWAVYWKADHPFLNDPRVRQGLTLAIDRRRLLAALNLPADLPLVDGPYTPDQFLRDDLPDPLPFDPPGARTLLAEAGWRDSDGDEILDRDGQPFEVTALIRTFSSENMPGNEAMGVLVQSDLRAVGVRMNLLPLEPAVVGERQLTGDFEAVFSWFRSYEQPWLTRLNVGEGPPLGYRNAQVADLIEEAGRTWEPEEEDRIYSQLLEIFRRDQPLTVLHPFVGLSVAHRRIGGLSSPWRSDPVAYMDELWLEASR